MWLCATEHTGAPRDLEVGWLVERFQQTPFQLGLCDQNDVALLYRALEAVAVYRMAEKYARGDWDALSDDEWKVIAEVREEVKRLGSRKRRKTRKGCR